LQIEITDIKNQNQILKIDNYELQLKLKYEKEKQETFDTTNNELSAKVISLEERNKNLVALINELEKK
jgi:hypothetical protein